MDAQTKTENKTIVLTVDYDRPLEEAVKAGKYDWVISHITRITQERFQHTQRGKYEVTLELVHFGRKLWIEEAQEELDRMGFYPANFQELLALGEAEPELQREFPIEALGSRFRISGSEWGVPHLRDGDDGRGLGVDWVATNFSPRCRFLAVRKSV